jgi:hypothetical protein
MTLRISTPNGPVGETWIESDDGQGIWVTPEEVRQLIRELPGHLQPEPDADGVMRYWPADEEWPQRPSESWLNRRGR